MAILRVPAEGKTVNHPEEIAAYLARFSIQYEIWKPEYQLESNPPPMPFLVHIRRKLSV
jgi:hypothetical protein